MIKNMLIEAIDTLLMSHTKPKLRIFSERLATICERKDADAFLYVALFCDFMAHFLSCIRMNLFTLLFKLSDR